MLSPDSVRRSLRTTKARYALHPDDITGCVTRDCVEELTEVFMDIFNTSLSQAVPDVPKSHHRHSGPEEAVLLHL